MPAPPPPEMPPWDFSPDELFYGLSISLEEIGFDELAASTFGFDDVYDNRAKQIIPGITKELRIEAQTRSPYLYGILKGAHMDETVSDGESYMGIVRIDPEVWHPILGGRPVDYGHRIHTQEGRPWFAWTIDEEADRIIQKYGAELVDVYIDALS